MSIEDRITEIVVAHPQADEWGYPIEECHCGETFTGTYAAHVARVLVTELGFTEFKCSHQRWWSTKFYPTEDA